MATNFEQLAEVVFSRPKNRVPHVRSKYIMWQRPARTMHDSSGMHGRFDQQQKRQKVSPKNGSKAVGHRFEFLLTIRIGLEAVP